MSLGKNLSLIRKIWNLEQADISALLGVNPNMISNYEKGKSYPRVPALLKYEEITGIPIYELCTTEIDINRIPGSPLKKYKVRKINPEDALNSSAANSEKLMELQEKLIKAMEEKSAIRDENIALREELAKLR